MEQIQKYTTEQRQLILSTCAKLATKEEFETFMYLCEQYGLDPIKKEIWFIKYGSATPIIQTSRDGYLKIANTHPQFDGLESDVVYQGDTLLKRQNGSILISYADEHMKFEKGKLRGAFCNVFRKDRSIAVSIFVSIQDYAKDGSTIWKQYPNAMILKVAESMALKRAFAISGLVTKEEIEDDGEVDKTITTTEVQNAETDNGLITAEQLEQLEYELRDHNAIKATMLNALGFNDLKELPKTKFQACLNRIREIKRDEFGT